MAYDPVRAAHRLLASVGYYKGQIESPGSDATWKAVAVTERNDRASVSPLWSNRRRLVAAAQRVLNAQGYEAGAVDGYDGHNTREAYRLWEAAADGKPERVARPKLKSRPQPTGIPRQRDCPKVYGDPARGQVASRLGWAEAPAPMRLDWNLSQTVTRLRVHELCAPSLTDALAAVVAHYGEEEWRRLGLDRYAGGYNHRRMRGGSKWSMHAYGCAIDIYAAPNGLRTRCPKALFCGSEYKPVLDIMEAHGWLNAGRLWGADLMHWQRATL